MSARTQRMAGCFAAGWMVVAAVSSGACHGRQTGPASPSPAVSTPASPPPSSTLLRVPFAFVSTRDTYQYIYISDGEGSALRRLTSGRSPDWSRDDRIAFEAVGGRPDGIYAINADGSGERYIGSGHHPSWAPDGRAIAVTRYDGIYILNVDGVNAAERAVRPPAGYAFVIDPAWSPDGRRIAFSACNESPWGDTGPCRVYIASLDDGTSSPVPFGGYDSYSPAWSVDGSQLAFGSDGMIHVGDPIHGGFRPMASGDTPAWSPDGRVVFTWRWQGSFGTRVLIAENGVARLLVPEPSGQPNPNYQDYDVTVSR